MKRLKILLCILLLCIPAAALLRMDGLSAPTRGALADGSYFAGLNRRLTDALPAGLRRFDVQLELAGGQMEQNDIFISKEGLIKNIDATGQARANANTDAILRFAQETQISTYLALFPTSGAILQQQLPPYADIYNNQKQTIDEIYSAVSGKVTAVDIYSILLNKRSQYIYYRTENNLTALGGYYAYTMLGSKMLRHDVLAFSDFDIKYLSGGFYGDLYQKSPYQDVRPDTLSVYHCLKGEREYRVIHRKSGGVKQYNTLYPLHLAELGQMLDVYFGGVSAITEIRNSSPLSSPRSLLVFGDKTALAYLPLLANHYERVTLVDLFQLTDTMRESIHPDEYHQVLFAYSLETYDTDIPARAAALLPDSADA